nr:pentatricopeptide repeat-containing protein At5g39350 [Ipomoea batatas]
MGEVQEPKFFCKFCNKACFTGKSLGGHMRCHLDLIAAAKKQKLKPQSSEGEDLGVSEETISAKNQEKGKRMSFGENGDQASYGLREKPLKSWKVSDSKHCGLKKRNKDLFSEFEEAQDAAMCLMMLSRGVKTWNEFLSSANCESPPFFCKEEMPISGYDDDDDISWKNISEICVNGCITIEPFKNPEMDEASFDLHYLGMGEMGETSTSIQVSEAKATLEARAECNLSTMELETVIGGVMAIPESGTRSREHACPVCLKVFQSGQALGGHKRAHYSATIEPKVKKENLSDIHEFLDLNLPVNAATGTAMDGAMEDRLWCIGSAGRVHTATKRKRFLPEWPLTFTTTTASATPPPPPPPQQRVITAPSPYPTTLPHQTYILHHLASTTHITIPTSLIPPQIHPTTPNASIKPDNLTFKNSTTNGSTPSPFSPPSSAASPLSNLLSAAAAPFLLTPSVKLPPVPSRPTSEPSSSADQEPFATSRSSLPSNPPSTLSNPQLPISIPKPSLTKPRTCSFNSVPSSPRVSVVKKSGVLRKGGLGKRNGGVNSKVNKGVSFAEDGNIFRYPQVKLKPVSDREADGVDGDGDREVSVDGNEELIENLCRRVEDLGVSLKDVEVDEEAQVEDDGGSRGSSDAETEPNYRSRKGGKFGIRLDQGDNGTFVFSAPLPAKMEGRAGFANRHKTEFSIANNYRRIGFMNGPSQPLSKTLKHLLSIPAAAKAAGAAAQCESLLYHCSITKSLATTKQVHARTIRIGLLEDNSTHFLSLLTAGYALCGRTLNARKLFDELPLRTLLSYKAMIRMYAETGAPRDALKLFGEMLRSGHHVPDRYTFPFVIRACGDLLLRDLGVVVHGLAVLSGVVLNAFMGNSLLVMYMNCGDKEGARRVFDVMQERTVVSWNIMIGGYFRNGSAKEALMVFRKMTEAGVDADCATVLSVLPVCGYLQDVKVGREVHSLAEEKGFWDLLPVRNALVDMYVKCGRMDEAQLVFDKMIGRDVVTWTTMVNGYILDGDITSALQLCRTMQFEGVKPNAITLASFLAACASLCDSKLGKCLHGWAIRQKLDSDANVETALIDMYAKCNCSKLSFQVFTKTSKKRTVPWNAVLSGCLHNELSGEAILLFKQMLSEDVKPNDATVKSILPAYAIEADLQQVMSLHSYLMRSGFITRREVATGLVDIYSKCGKLDYGHKIFNEVPQKERDIVLWGAIIAGYGAHGHGEIAISLFNQMVHSQIEPNEVTFTSVLHACSHAGLVDDGLSLFNFMRRCHPAYLGPHHYTCMVDLFGRAGRLEEAYDLIKSMPFQPTHAIWGALLGACAIHENAELGEVAAKWLFELEPQNTGNYVLLGNIYSALGRWEDAENVRRLLNEVGLKKLPAQSAI